MDLETALYVHEQLGPNSFEVTEATKQVTAGMSALHNLFRARDEHAIFSALKSAFNINHSDAGEFKHLRIASEKLTAPLTEDQQRGILLDLYKNLRT